MPRPPEFGGFTELRFITNYYLTGCNAPFELVLELSREPAGDLLLLFIGFDEEEWFQEIFQPGRGRRRTPARKGRKRRRGFGIPDWNAYLAGKVRGFLPGWEGIKLPGARVIFRLWGVVDLFNFSVAVLEGVTAIGFEHLWGVFKIDRNNCSNMARLGRRTSTDITVGGVGPPVWPVNIDTVEFTRDFFIGAPFGTRTDQGDYVCAYRTRLEAANNLGARGSLVLTDENWNVIARRGPITLSEGNPTTLRIAADIPNGQDVYWGWEVEYGSVRMWETYVLCFTTQLIPWWSD